MNGKRIIRYLVFGVWATLALAVVTGLALQSRLPEPLREHVRDQPFTWRDSISAMLALASLGFLLRASVLILRERAAGRKALLISVVLGIAILPFSGPVVSDPWSETFAYVSAVLTGVLIGWLYLANVRLEPEAGAGLDSHSSGSLPPVATSPRRSEFRHLKKFLLVCAAIAAGGIILALAAMAIITALEPTPKPVFGTAISQDHRDALQHLMSPDENILGLYSTGTFRVTEGGCPYTNQRVVVYESGELLEAVAWPDIEGFRLNRVRSWTDGNSEIAVMCKDATQMYLQLPNASERPHDVGVFHRHLVEEWRQRRSMPRMTAP